MIEQKFNIDFNTCKITYIDKYTNQLYNVNKCDKDNKVNLAIVGSRSITDTNFVNRIINCYCYMFSKPIKVISGGAGGVDTIAEKWADANHIEKEILLADWETYGKKAGFIRNKDIINKCDVCLCIWDGSSHGTKHDIELCETLNKEIIIFNYKEYKDNVFSGFYYRKYDRYKEELNFDNQTIRKNSNRWLPQPGIIHL